MNLDSRLKQLENRRGKSDTASKIHFCKSQSEADALDRDNTTIVFILPAGVTDDEV